MPIDRMQAIFEPTSVALFGASNKPNSLGTVVLDNLVNAGFEGPIHLINPHHDRIGERKVYGSLREIEGQIDLAVIMTPARTVPDILTECGKRGVRGAIIISAGFREAGAEGQALEQEISWIPGSILLYHSISAWVWESNRRAAGHRYRPESLRIGWCSANAVTGVLTLLVAWSGKAS